MFIKQILWRSRYDFGAILGCEHCDHEAELKTGYDDEKYHHKVIPAMLCKGCRKNRSGGNEATNPEVGVETH